MSLNRSAINGSMIAIAGYGISQIIRLGGNIAIAALLYREAFGLMAIANSISACLNLLSDVGLNQIVIRSRRGDDPDFLNTIWTVGIIRSAFISVGMAALTYPIASYYAATDPRAIELERIIPLVALGNFVYEFKSIGLMTAARHLQVVKTVSIDLLTQIIAAVVSLGLAWKTGSVMSLAVGIFLQGLAYALLSRFLITSVPHRIYLERAALVELRQFSGWVFISTALTYFATQFDRLVFAKFFPLDVVGLYSIAIGLAGLVPTLLNRVGASVLLPLFSRTNETEGSLAGIYRGAARPAVILISFVVAMMIAGAPSFVGLMYDRSYSDAALFIQILAVGSWFASVDNLYTSAYVALNHVRYAMLVNLAKVASFVIFLAAALAFGNIVIAVIAVSASEVMRIAVDSYLGRRLNISIGGGFELLALLQVGAIAGGLLVFTGWLRSHFATPHWLGLIVVFVGVSSAYLPQLLGIYRDARFIYAKPTARAT